MMANAARGSDGSSLPTKHAFWPLGTGKRELSWRYQHFHIKFTASLTHIVGLNNKFWCA